ncbi:MULTISPECIES: response regulator transcription factor [Chromobacterium]|uniref:DNA-binding response regulator n=1 Tax=Chromobacterium haemolyticum TaxID=394935 RepID=A0A1W0CTL0_9NEIS|nr:MULTISPECIES: response regulator [Chromobacterium]OQS38071.1 DNA-binding response regulator [Chromobacterium haemolyticum]QOZ84291.1 DNA-binding response regulator [Chromobacterium sp. Rain0013]WON84471.1 response regulator [Chromobacterium haemolyticum]
MAGKRLAIIDDDAAVRESLVWLLDGQGYLASGFDSAEDFLACPDGGDFNGIILDLRLSGMSGIMLLEKLAGWPYCPPVIMLTAHGDVPHAVAALKLGALDFMEKPFDDERLLERAEAAVLRDEQNRLLHGRRSKVSAALSLLTDREREVMQLILTGKLNKQIAEELTISMKTVEVHRARVFDKMGVKSAVELAGLLASQSPANGGKR